MRTIKWKLEWKVSLFNFLDPKIKSIFQTLTNPVESEAFKVKMWALIETFFKDQSRIDLVLAKQKIISYHSSHISWESNTADTKKILETYFSNNTTIFGNFLEAVDALKRTEDLSLRQKSLETLSPQSNSSRLEWRAEWVEDETSKLEESNFKKFIEEKGLKKEREQTLWDFLNWCKLLYIVSLKDTPDKLLAKSNLLDTYIREVIRIGRRDVWYKELVQGTIEWRGTDLLAASVEKGFWFSTQVLTSVKDSWEQKIVTGPVRFPLWEVKITEWPSGNFILNVSATEQLSITPLEKEQIEKSAVAKENFINFYKTLKDLWMEKIWVQRATIFKGIKAWLWDTSGFKIDDGNYMSKEEMGRFLWIILKSVSKEVQIESWKITKMTTEQIIQLIKTGVYKDSAIQTDKDWFTAFSKIFFTKFFPSGSGSQVLWEFKTRDFQDSIK